MPNRKKNKIYVRCCKRCEELYKTTQKTSKICPKCSRFNCHTKKYQSQIKLCLLFV